VEVVDDGRVVEEGLRIGRREVEESGKVGR
jgi:hypothetical protein